MTNKELKEILALRVDGYSYEEIGEKYGLSKQRIHQIVRTAVDVPSMTKKKRYKYSNLYTEIAHNYSSVVDFAEQIGERPTTIYTWLSGKLPKNIKTLLKICKALDADIHYLFEEEMEEQEDDR